MTTALNIAATDNTGSAARIADLEAQLAQMSAENARLRAEAEITHYVFQDDLHNRLTPRVVDIAYNAFLNARRPNTEDGGATDWFTDTRPMVMEKIAEIQRDTRKHGIDGPALDALIARNRQKEAEK